MTKITIYTRPHCSNCEKAKALLAKNNLPYEELNIDVHKNQLLETYPSLKILPVVFFYSTYIGSLKELEEYIEHERLEQ